MLVLGIDTATPVTSVAVGSEAGALAALAVRHERGHAELLVPAIRFLLDQAGVQPATLGGVAVGCGPGLFTGLRVGVATAKALAQTLTLPVVAVSSLDLVALAHRFTQDTICATIDARRGEVFAAFYHGVPGGVQRVGAIEVLRPDRLAAEVEARDEHVLLCGDGALAHAAAFGHLAEQIDLATAARSTPSAELLVELALPRFHREEFCTPFEVAPLYVRRPNVDPAIEARLAAERGGLLQAAGSGLPPVRG